MHWVTERDNLKLAEETFSVLEDAASFVESMARSFGSERDVNNPIAAFDELGGLPVVTVRFENGAPVSETVLISTKARDFEADEFAIPVGYQEQQVPGPGGAAGRR